MDIYTEISFGITPLIVIAAASGAAVAAITRRRRLALLLSAIAIAPFVVALAWTMLH